MATKLTLREVVTCIPHRASSTLRKIPSSVTGSFHSLSVMPPNHSQKMNTDKEVCPVAGASWLSDSSFPKAQLAVCRHTCHAHCAINRVLFQRKYLLETHESSFDAHPECSYECHGLKLLTPKRDRPIRVLVVLEAMDRAVKQEDAVKISQFHRYQKPAKNHPSVLAYQHNILLRKRYVWLDGEDYICHDWVSGLIYFAKPQGMNLCKLYLCAGISDPRVAITLQAFDDFANELNSPKIAELRLTFDVIMSETLHAAIRWCVFPPLPH
jgi:hypothetical protein